jgi:Cu(I)/Ag(I) efflux system membrane fusion protein
MRKITLLILGGILLFAVGFYSAHVFEAFGNSQSSGNNVKPIDEHPALNSAQIEQQGAELVNQIVKIQEVQIVPVVSTIRLNGKLALDALRVHQVTTRVAGRVERFLAFEGAPVKSGEILAYLYSPEYISAQNEFLLARQTARTLNNPATQDLYQDALATLQAARNKLLVMGLLESDLQQLDSTGRINLQLPVRAPVSGRLIKRMVDPGGYLDVGAGLGTVADVSSVWFIGNAFEADLPSLREGLKLRIALNGNSQPVFAEGVINFISPTVDPDTHSVVVRASLPNQQGQLKPEMLAMGEVMLPPQKLPVVPRAAVVQDGAESFIMVQRQPNQFERVSVRVGAGNNSNELSVLSGIHEHDQIVVDGSVLVDRSLNNPQADKIRKPKIGHKGNGG